MQFTQNTEASEERFFGGRIEKTGATTGMFIRAYEEESANTGSKCLHLDFISNAGEDGTIRIWYYSGGKDAEIEMGKNTIEGILMPLLKIPSLKSKPNDIIQVYDFNLGQTVDKKVTSFPQLCNKQIGVVWQRTVYKRNKQKDGEWFGVNVEAVRYFDAETKQTSSEKVKDLPATLLEKYLDKLPDLKVPKDLQEQYYAKEDAHIMNQAKSQPSAQTYMPGTNPTPTIDADYDDDLPF